MFWADRIAKEIIQAGNYKPYKVDDMFTPSGYAHVGSLRGSLFHDIISRALRDAGESPTYTFVINDFDPLDGLPQDLQDKFAKYLGLPLRNVPSPEPKFDSFADYFADDFKKVLTGLGMKAEFLSSWDMYHEGKFNQVICEALDRADKIRAIYKNISGSKKGEDGNWYPFQVICPNCGKIGTIRVVGWNGKAVSFVCEPEMVGWARGCGNTGEMSPFDGNGKLPWKVDWPAHWKVIGVTIEGAGKDHSTAGGSRDIAREICSQVFDYPEPYNLPYEFFLLGGKKMSSSKGLGLKARDLTTILPANIARFLFSRTDYREAIEFDPVGTMAIPDLFDEYDRSWNAHINNSDESLSRAFVLSQTGEMPPKTSTFLPRFKDIANYIQLPSVDLKTKFGQMKGSKLNDFEIKIFTEREKYAQIWLDKYAPDEAKFVMATSLPDKARCLTDGQKKFLAMAVEIVEKETDPENLQTNLYNLSKELGLGAKDAFAAIYIAFTGREFGPKAAWFLQQYPKEQVVARMREAVESKEEVL